MTKALIIATKSGKFKPKRSRRSTSYSKLTWRAGKCVAPNSVTTV